MLSRWVHKLVLDVQFGRVRLVPPVLLTGYVVFVMLLPNARVDQNVLLLVGAVLLFGSGAWPLAVALGEVALLVPVSRLSSTATQVVGLFVAVALLELAVRRPLRQAAVVVLALTVANLVIACVFRRVIVVNVLAVEVAVPLLLGAWLRLVLRGQKEKHLRDLRRAQQAERTEIARELHDLVTHHVASMALRAGIARAVLPDLDPRVRAVLDDVHGSATTALADLRRLVGVLRDQTGGGSRLVHVEQTDLPAAVTEVIDGGTQAGLEVARHVDPAITTLDSVRGLAVLRLVQEGLTNVAKHAAGARTAVRVDLVDGDVVVEVTDDGGVPDRHSPLPATDSGYGLVGLRERVEMVGGTLTAGPHGDARRPGWRLHATLPVVERP